MGSESTSGRIRIVSTVKRILCNNTREAEKDIPQYLQESPTMSINTTLTPHEVSNKAMAETTTRAKKPAERVVVTVEKQLHTPVSSKKIATDLIVALPCKPVHTHRKSIVAKIHSVAVADRCDPVFQQNEERMSARNLRRIKRRLFLEAVNSNHVESPRKPHRNLVRLEVTEKKNRMGSG